jgi:hypothetical protein
MYERGQAPDTHVHVQHTWFGGDVPLLGNKRRSGARSINCNGDGGASGRDATSKHA